MSGIQSHLSQDPSPKWLGTVAGVIEYLQRNFGDPDEKATTRRQLQSLRQTGTAAEYFLKFREIIAVLGWVDKDLIIYVACKGLNAKIKDCITRLGHNFLT
jgi:hypothetical protein